MNATRAGLDTEALLLRSTPYRDADRIVTLFTERLGKVSAVARSARNSRRRFGGTLEPFVRFRAALVPGTGELFSLRETEPLQVFSHIVTDLTRVQLAAAALRLVRELSPVEQAEPALFAALLRFLTCADLSAAFDHHALLAFAMHVLELVGTAPSLSQCGGCGAQAPEGRAVTFDARSGMLRCRRCGGAEYGLSARARAWLTACREDWMGRAENPLPEQSAHAARRALGAFLKTHAHADLASLLQVPD